MEPQEATILKPENKPTESPMAQTPKSSGPNVITILAMALFVLFTLSAVAFLYYQNQELKKILANYQQPESSPIPTTNTDPISDWKTYTNTEYQFSFKYPSTWKDITDEHAAKNGNTQFMFQTSRDEFVTGNIFTGKIDASKDLAWSKHLSLTNDKSLLMTYTDDLGPGSKGGTVDIEVFEQVVSTFKLLEVSNTPIVTSPLANTKVLSPLEIKGIVPAGWMFEGSFPIRIVDSKKILIAQGTAKEVKPGSWQSGKPVEFAVTLPFSTTEKTGFLILSNDNPSGDPEKSKTFEVPLKF